MTQETTQSGPKAAETGHETANGVEDMAKMMEQCGCRGSMMEKMKSFMPVMCGTSGDGEGKAETDGKAETEGKTGGMAGRG